MNRQTTLASTFALLGLIGCKQEPESVAAKDYPKQMALSYCKAVYSCPCESYPYDDFNECFGELESAYDEVNDEAFLAGLTYDGTCPAHEVDQIEALACKSYIPPLPSNVCIPPCNVWHGSLPAGSICEVVASSAELGIGFSNCAQGLSCIGGVCGNPCQVDNNLPGLGQPCPELICQPGLMCDESMVCVMQPDLPGPGEACANGACDPDRAVCVADANICAALPGVGQECVQGQCSRDAYCGSEDVCVARPPLACGLLAGGIPGDGDGDPTGDGDGDPTGDGDGDGDPTGDGDGDPTGDGDGDGECNPAPLAYDTFADAYGGTFSSPAIESGSCGGSGPEAVYSFTAPVSGTYGLSTAGSASGYDTVLHVRDGSCDGPELACNDDYDGSVTWSALLLDLAAGQEIVIFVDSYGEPGDYSLVVGLQ